MRGRKTGRTPSRCSERIMGKSFFPHPFLMYLKKVSQIHELLLIYTANFDANNKYSCTLCTSVTKILKCPKVNFTW
jgi:hypothetical protein